MRRVLLPLLIAMTLTACDSSPSAVEPAGVKIVAADARDSLEGGRTSISVDPVSPPEVQNATGTMPTRQLTVEESAKLNTSEMWSEPASGDDLNE